MRIVSWNVNGLYTTLKDATHRFSSASIYFTTILHADIVCFQEAKIQEEKLEKWMACVPGFESFWAFSQAKKGYSGVVTYVKDDLSPLDAAAENLPGDVTGTEDLCREGRIVETDHGSFVLINVYVPNAGDREEGRPRLDFKVRFLQALRRKCDELVSSGRHVVVVGDFNVAHKADDVHKKWNVEEIYSSDEKDWMDNFMTEYVDLFRHFHPVAKDVFSVWEAKTDARIHNEGLRIDFAVCDKGFLPQVKDTQILKMVPKNWSDHAAVVLTLQQQPALSKHPAASLSSRNMKRFQEDHRQKKLTSLFSRGASKPMAASSTGGTVAIKKAPLDHFNSAGHVSVALDSETQSQEASNAEGGNEQQHVEIQEHGNSPDQNPPSLRQDGCKVLVDDLLVGTNGNHTGQKTSFVGLVPTVDPTRELGSIQGDHEEKRVAEVSDGKCFNTQDENGLDASVTSKEEKVVPPHVEARLEVEASTLETGRGSPPQSDQKDTLFESGRSSPVKRKQPLEPSSETGGPGKQRNLTSYFKVVSNNSEPSRDDQCK